MHLNGVQSTQMQCFKVYKIGANAWEFVMHVYVYICIYMGTVLSKSLRVIPQHINHKDWEFLCISSKPICSGFSTFSDLEEELKL